MLNKNILTLPLALYFRQALYKGSLALCNAANSEGTNMAPDKFLHPAELARYNSFKYPAKRKSFLGGRIAAKQSLLYLLESEDPCCLEISSGVFDQPITELDTEKNCEVSISHSGDYAAAIAFPAGFQMGTDLENISGITAEKLGSITGQFACDERSYIDAEGEERDIITLMLWSMKECLSKALKCGLTTSFTVLETSDFKFKPEGESSCCFKNFPQYSCSSVIAGNYILSIIYSVDMKLTGVNIDLIENFLSN